MITVGHRSDQAYVFFCTSADTLPTTLPSGLAIPIGSNLYLTDTNDELKWTGTVWYNFAQDVEVTPVYNPLITTLINSVQQQTNVLTQILASQQYNNMLLSSSMNVSQDDLDVVSSTLM